MAKGTKRFGPWSVIFVLWLALIVAGMVGLWLYSTAPGKEADPPERWPAFSAFQRTAGASIRLMFVHPKCPCSNASISELAVLLAHSAGNLRAQVIFLKPTGKEDDWVHTGLWREASKLAAAVVVSDPCGREADLFHAAVSGETMLYDAEGHLKFHGGITGARGHVGANAGSVALESYANAGALTRTRTPVFGCPLFNQPVSQTP
jgi:hypothetical protein